MSTTKKKASRVMLMDRMATRNGADLDLAQQSGLVSEAEMLEALVLCMGCSDPDGCAARIESDKQGIPGFCRNGEFIARVEALTR